MLHFVTSYMKQNKNCKQILETAQYGLEISFKRVIYIVRKTLSRGMKDYNEFAHISNTVDIHSVCRDFGWGYINDQSTNRTR